jgi:class 3 adenylate cyclase
MRDALRPVVARWHERGHRLDAGFSVSFGYATLGMIGFEARNDYSAIGSVVNLAARLCSEAASGEILIDRRAMHALRDRVPGQARELVLKGIPGAVTAYLIGDRAAATVEGASTADR